MNSTEIAEKKWQKNWAGPWSLLSCAYLGYQYTIQLKEAVGISLEEALFVTHKGITSCYFLDEHKEAFGRTLAKQAEEKSDVVLTWAGNLKNVTDHVLSVVKKLELEPVTTENFSLFIDALYRYGVAHRIVKVVVDYLPEDLVTHYLTELSEARVYAEPAYEETEKYMQYVASQVAIKEGSIAEHILALKQDQWTEYLEKGVLPKKEILEGQYEDMILYMNNGVLQYIEVKAERNEIEKALLGEDEESELKGQVAYKGKVTGRVRIVLNPIEVQNFAEGDILVTGMTRPEYLSLVQKAAGFVTDAGGILSHAAITARELQKPCVIGTNRATKVLKDGDLVEVDADNGVVRILETS